MLLAKARKLGEANLGALNDAELVKKLLWGRDAHNEKAQSVIEACAIFDVLGFTGAAAVQRNFVAEELCGIKGEELSYGICQAFIGRGVCQTGGDFIQVTPKPLALRLAAEWWQKRPPDTVAALLERISKNNLGQALCDQMAKLDFLPQARELTKELCGDSGPFGKAEVLASDEGSRLFRSLVEVNPSAGVLKRWLKRIWCRNHRRIEIGRRDGVAISFGLWRKYVFGRIPSWLPPQFCWDSPPPKMKHGRITPRDNFFSFFTSFCPERKHPWVNECKLYETRWSLAIWRKCDSALRRLEAD